MKEYKLSETEKENIQKYNYYLSAVVGDDGIVWSANLYYYDELDWNGGAVPSKGGWERRKEIDNDTTAMQTLESIAYSIVKNTNYYDYTECEKCNGSAYIYIYYNPLNKTFKHEIDVYVTLSEEKNTEDTFENVVQKETWFASSNSLYKNLNDQTFVDQLIDENDGETFFEFEYNGGGDSGQIESSLPYGSKILNIAYEIIDLYHGGWENDQGADGTINIDLKNKTVKIFHLEFYDESINMEIQEVKLV